MSEFKKIAKGLGQDVLLSVRTSLGDDYDSLTDEQKQSIKDTAAKVVEMQLREAAGEDVVAKKQALETTVRDWKVWGEFGIEAAFWKGVQEVAKAFGTFLGGFAAEAASRIVPGL